MEKPVYICQSTVLSMGISKREIEENLPEPKLVPNPYSKKSAPMKLYEKSSVEAYLETDEHQLYALLTEKRRASAQKAVATKRQKTLDEVSQIADKISVQRISLMELCNRAVAAKRQWYEYIGSDRTTDGAPDDVVNRWMVNYVRHNLTEYDAALCYIRNRVAKDVAYFNIREIVMQKIEDAYPELF